VTTERSKPRGPSRRYRERAAALAAAIDVGAELAPAAQAASAASWRRMAVEPAIGHDTMAGLAALEEAFFTYWNEADGEHVETFWRRIAERGLPFTRVDPIRAMIERGGIRTAIERDALVVLVAERRAHGTLRDEEAAAVERAVADFAARAARRGGPQG
jgi:hypothetical protein